MFESRCRLHVLHCIESDALFRLRIDWFSVWIRIFIKLKFYLYFIFSFISIIISYSKVFRKWIQNMLYLNCSHILIECFIKKLQSVFQWYITNSMLLITCWSISLNIFVNRAINKLFILYKKYIFIFQKQTWYHIKINRFCSLVCRTNLHIESKKTLKKFSITTIFFLR